MSHIRKKKFTCQQVVWGSDFMAEIKWDGSVQLLRHVRLFATSWTAAHQASLSITNSRNSPKPMSTELVMPSNHLIPFSSCPQSFPASGSFHFFKKLFIYLYTGSFQMSQFFASGGQSIGVSAVTSVLSMNTQDQSPCSPRVSQESSPTPQFKSINSSLLNFLYGPTLTSIHDYWKNHSFD